MKIRFALVAVLPLLLLSCDRLPDSLESETSLRKLAKKVIVSSDDDEMNGTFEFKYDSDGMLSELVNNDGTEQWGHLRYVRTENKIRIVVDKAGVDELLYTLYLYEEGPLAGRVYKYTSDRMEYLLEYTEDGYLSNLDVGNYNYAFAWQDGNMISWYGGYEIERYSIENKCNIDVMTLCDFGVLHGPLCDRNMLKGVFSKDLFKIDYSDLEVSYKFDSDNYPVEINMSEDDYTIKAVIEYYE